MNKLLIVLLFVCTMLPVPVHGQTTTASSAATNVPVVLHMTELQQLQIEAKIKDFQILQLQFAQLITQIKQANQWGDDVMYDAQKNVFYRQSTTTAEQGKTITNQNAKPTDLPERKK